MRLGNLRTWTASAVAHRPALSRTLFQAPPVDGANLKSYWPPPGGGGRIVPIGRARTAVNMTRCAHQRLSVHADPVCLRPVARARSCTVHCPLLPPSLHTHSRGGLIASALPPRRPLGRTWSRRTQSASCGLARLPRHATLRTRACTPSCARPQMTASRTPRPAPDA